MIRAIKFDIPNSWGNHLYEILKGIDIKNYDWEVYNSEILHNGIDCDYFEEHNMSGESFYKKISSEESYIIFLRLIGFNKGESLKSYAHDYDEFIKSNYQMLLEIYDSTYVYFFCRDNKIFEKINKTLADNNIETEKLSIERIKSALNDFLQYY